MAGFKLNWCPRDLGFKIMAPLEAPTNTRG